jgi:hypothetical protein
MSKIPMPIAKLVELIAEGCADYADGDDPGYFRISYDPNVGELFIAYEPDTDQDGTEFEARHLPTTYLFTVGTKSSAALGWPEGGTR